MNNSGSSAKGTEQYPVYCALWPLQAMRLLDEKAVDPEVWTDIRDKIDSTPKWKQTRVAVIDTSVAIAHPCLQKSINSELMLDLVSEKWGAFPFAKNTELPDLGLSDSERLVEGNAPAERLLRRLEQRLKPGMSSKNGGLTAEEGWKFSTHGTAIVGLIGGRPCFVAHQPLATSKPVDLPLPFSGVDPFCEIVPIATGFDADPQQLILALLYADMIRADIVVIPRDFPDPRHQTKVASDIREPIKLGKALEHLLKALSEYVPVVCAAGNDGAEKAIYPASLAAEADGIIAVGAVNSKGYTAGYSNFGPQIDVYAPSSDSERFDAEEIRLDDQDRDYDKDLKVPTGNVVDYFSSLNVISTDVPGRYGYNGSRFAVPDINKAVRDYGALFCRFGGTSASAALVSGFISLGMTAGICNKGDGGAAVKHWLLQRCRRTKAGLSVPVWKDQDPWLPPPEPSLDLSSAPKL